MVKSNSLGFTFGAVKITQDSLGLDFLKGQSEDQAMKKWQVTIAVAVAAGVALCGNLSAWAGSYNSFTDQRRMIQEQRIQEAWQAGQLTPGEYQRLQNQQQRICMIENQMRADGRLDPGEKVRLNEMLNYTERAIDRSTYRCWRPGYYRARCRPEW